MQILFTDREADIMDVLWDHGPSTVAEVRARLADRLAYTTVLTILRTLEAKGYVGHEEDGRAHRYLALVDRGTARGAALTHLEQKLFKGSPALLLTHMVSGRRLTDAQIGELRKLLDQHAKKGK